MNIYKCLNDITEYIDNHLEDKIDYNILAKMMGVNTYTLLRIFSLLTGISLADYIRKRRLSMAGFDLYQTKTKIIDIAIKYRYENATSFSRAFEKFHGLKPSQVKKDGYKLKNYPKLVFNEEVKTNDLMEYKIIEMNEFSLYGIGVNVTNKTISKEAPKLCEKASKKYGNIDYGMVIYEDLERDYCSKYYALYIKEIKELEKVTIPKSKWIVIKINSRNAKDIQELVNKFYLEFLPSSKYNLKNMPELEYYHYDYTEFLVPIE